MLGGHVEEGIELRGNLRVPGRHMHNATASLDWNTAKANASQYEKRRGTKESSF